MAELIEYIDPRIGGVAPFLVPTRPTIHQPNQMLRTYPNNRDYIDDQIDSFPLQILRTRGRGVLQMRVSLGRVTRSDWRRRMSIDHDLEVCKPWYFETYLIDDDITLSIAPGKKGAIYEMDFPAGQAKNILIYGTEHMRFEQLSSNAFSLHEQHLYFSKENPTRKPSLMPIYVYAEVQDHYGRPLEGLEMVFNEGSRLQITCSADGPQDLVFKYALSYIDAEQAKANFESELAGKTLATISTEAKKAWEVVLDKINVKGGTEAQRRSFYSALYRAHERMVDINEDGRYYSGYDEQVHESARPFYVDNGIWDTYRALHPLRSIINPSQEEDMLNSMVQMSIQADDWMPTYARPWGNHPCMVGYHSSGTFLDAYRKGLSRFDIEAAYRGIYNNLENGSWIPWRQGAPRTVLDEQTRELGYMPSLKIGEEESVELVDSFERRQPVAVTLSRAYDTWALSELAGELGYDDVAKIYADRSIQYRALWDLKHRLFMPKDKEGNWVEIDPKLDGGQGFRGYFDENNGWTYGWLVQGDIGGLQELLGGPEAMVERLDIFFREPLGTQKHLFHADGPDSTGMVGQFVMGNELSFHIPYLYNYAGAPWKTQQRVRFLLDVWFKDNIFGNPGDEDGGAMAAWVVLSSMGLYQVTPGIPVYTVASPIFEEISIALPDDRSFVISAPGSSKRNKYIQSASLNGESLDCPFITYAQIMAGGKLTLQLGEKPNREWGIDCEPPL